MHVHSAFPLRKREQERGREGSQKSARKNHIIRRSAEESSRSRDQRAFAMLTQRNGVCAGCVLPGKDSSDQMDVAGCTCAIGDCPWDCLKGVDGCLSDTSCLWFQLLARAYWGDVELGLRESQKGVSWRRPKKASQRNCMRSWVRIGGSEVGSTLEVKMSSL